jgi:hypothetical protein
MMIIFQGGADYRYFDIDRNSGHVTIKRSIPDDELIQPATLVVRVRKGRIVRVEIDDM